MDLGHRQRDEDIGLVQQERSKVNRHLATRDRRGCALVGASREVHDFDAVLFLQLVESVGLKGIFRLEARLPAL